MFLAVFALKLLWQSRHDERGLWWKVIAVLVGLAAPGARIQGLARPVPDVPGRHRGMDSDRLRSSPPPCGTACCSSRAPTQVKLAARHAVEHEGVPAMDETLNFQPEPEGTM